jgi:hypothetical protein
MVPKPVWHQADDKQNHEASKCCGWHEEIDDIHTLIVPNATAIGQSKLEGQQGARMRRCVLANDVRAYERWAKQTKQARRPHLGGTGAMRGVVNM